MKFDKEQIKYFIKLIWVLSVIFFISYYFYKKFNVLIKAFEILTIDKILISFLMILIAKVLLALNMQLVLNKYHIILPFKKAFAIYNKTQLAKYIPGLIWQFVGRIGIMKELGVDNRIIRDSLITEVIWILSSAFLTGGVILLFFYHSIIFVYIRKHLWLIWLLLSLLIMIVVVFYFLFEHIKKTFIKIKKLLPSILPLAVLILIWVFLSTSFWVLILPFANKNLSWLYCMGVYCVAYAIGFITPFAPAGIGVRESILVFGFSNFFIELPVLVLLVSINRIIYFITEIIVFLPVINEKVY